MRCTIPLLSIAFALVLSTVVHGQQEARPLLGLGMSIDPARLEQTIYVYSGYEGQRTIPMYNGAPIMLYVPISIADFARIEPAFGMYTASDKQTTTSSQQGSPYPSIYSAKGSVVTVGVRGTYVSHPSSSFLLYLGPRLDISFVSSTTEYSYSSDYPIPNTRRSSKTTLDEVDITVGAVAGAEYFPLSQFSLGGEVSLNYLSFGNPDMTREESPPLPPSPATTSTERERHSFRTDALFFLRWYFLQSHEDTVAP